MQTKPPIPGPSRSTTGLSIVFIDTKLFQRPENTKSVNKQLLPLFDKPMIFYPLSLLMLAKIRDILIITNKKDIDSFSNLLGDGKNLGIKIKYLEQKKANKFQRQILQVY